MTETSAAIAAQADAYHAPQFDRKTITLAVALFAGGWMIGHQAGDAFLPWQPQSKSRPMLKFLARLAKTGLWVMLAAEQPPSHDYAHHAYRHGELNHREGW